MELVLYLCCVGVQQLDVTDADTAPDDLEFLLEETPQHGTLLKVDGGVGSEMVNGKEPVVTRPIARPVPVGNPRVAHGT